MMPSILGENLFEDWMDTPFRHFYKTMPNSVSDGFNKDTKSLMNTDIKENEDNYTLDMELPGFTKSDINASLMDGYLTIEAKRTEGSNNNDEQDKKGNYIRKERFYGSCKRSFYIGEAVSKDDINAKFENGVLSLIIPKKDFKEAVEKNNYIAIEG